MREDNKSTNNSKMSQRKDSLSKKISVIFKALLPYINTTTIFTVILGLIYFLASIDQTFALTAEEIAEYQSNEMVSGMCYVYDIMTSNIARAIAAAFVVGTGWLFFLGGIKDWKPVLTFSIAITLIFGGFEIANIISHNDYSCAKPKKETEKDETIDSEEVEPDICKIRDIDEYSPQQKWKVCTRGSDGKIYTECSEIYDDFEISYKESERYVILVKCQEGYLKVAEDDKSNESNKGSIESKNYYKYGDDTNLKYKCTRVNSKKSIFVLVNNENEFEKTRCQKACFESRLENLMAVNMMEKRKDDEKKDEEFEIQPGSGRKEGNYFVVGTRITLECKDGFTKYEENEGEGIVAICKTNSEFEIKGGCNGKCLITNLSEYYKNSVKTWQKYNNKKNEWEDIEDIDNVNIYSNEEIRAKECNEAKGYSFESTILSSSQSVSIKDEDKLVLNCSKPDSSGVSSWVKSKGKECSKFCELYNFAYYNENTWKRCENNTEIKKGEHLFEIGSCLIINGCANQDDYSLLDTSKRLKLTCESNKDWKIENENDRCYKKCDPKDIGSYENASKWEINSPEETATKIVNASDFEKIMKVTNGTTLKQTECKDGYDFNGGKTPSTFECKDGKLERQDGLYDEKCMPKCFLYLLGKYDEKSLNWTEIYEDGRKLTPENKINPANVTEKEMTSSNHYFKLNECIKGYKRFKFVNNQITEERATDSENFIYYCDNSTSWVELDKKAMCAIVKCKFDLEAIKTDIGETNYNKLGIAYSNQWINLTNNNKNITVAKNNGTKYLYATKVKLDTCIQQTGTYLLGNKDTVLMCNEEGQWQLFNSDTNQLVNNIPNNNTKRCKVGMCKGNPLVKNSGSTLLSTNREGIYYNSIGNTLNTINDSTTDIYATNRSIIDANCGGTGVYEVGFGGTCDNCGNKSTTTQPHYYYCDNGTWKVSGSCFKGCNSKPSLITNSKFASANKTIYNSEGSSISASNISSQSGTLYYTNNVTIQGDCNSGYTEMTGGNAVNGGAITYTCDNGNWMISGGKCVKLCYGVPNGSGDNIVFESSNFSASGSIYNTSGTVNASGVNVSNMNNVYYGNNSTVTGGCKSGYTQAGGDIKYICNNGNWSKTGTGECKALCNDISPVMDVNGNVIAEHLYGMGYEYDKSYKVCFKNGKTSYRNNYYYSNEPQEEYVYNLNTEGTGLGYMEKDEYINCYYKRSINSFSSTNNYYRYNYDNIKLTCKNNSNTAYWEADKKSCDLNTIPTSSDITVKLAYDNNKKNISDIMNSGAKQKRLFSGKYLSTSIQNSEGSSFGINCNSDGNWSSYVSYSYTGGSQTFTPSKYGLYGGKQLTLEVYGAQGGGSKGGKGGYAKYYYTTNNTMLHVVIGGQGGCRGAGYNGGGTGGEDGWGASPHKGCGGGGATHISTISGLLNVENVWNNVLIVAGGGGGTSSDNKYSGGAGGGGNKNGEDGGNGGKGGTTTAGGERNGDAGSGGKGYGGRGENKGGTASGDGGGAGGGGYYGGGGGKGATDTDNTGGGGGGSGYCKSSSNCIGSNGVREGNGEAKISW